MAGMLVGAPFSVKSRKITIAVFFGAAACAGLAGLLQHFNVLHNKIYHGAHGYLSNPIFYAADLAFVSGSAIIMLFIHDNAIIKSWKELLFLVLIALLTFGGIIVSLSRGVWITFLAASMITLSIYDKKKAAVVFLSLLLIIISLFYFSPFFRQRAISTVTSLYTENEQNSTGNRIELWKGSLLIVQKSPLVGVGIGDFEQSIDELINAQKLKMMPAKMHAHNIFFQVLSTQGIIGFVVFIGLLAALISWGFGEIHSGNMNGGYIIILSTLLTMIGGLTESTIVISKFLAVYCLTIGLLGPYGARNRSSPAHLSAEIV
jgi:O-antigen ligase